MATAFPEDAFNLYGYDPSLAAGVVFIVLFALLTIAHATLVVRSRIWWLSVLVVGGFAECVGWVGRSLSSGNPEDVNFFLMQIICLTLAPCFFSAAVYATLGMLIRHLGAQYSRLPPHLYLWIFCLADLVAIVIQAVGGGMAAIALLKKKGSVSGTNTMVAGIVIQLASMLAFSILGLDYYFRARQGPSFAEKSRQGRINLLAGGLAFASVWILIRCIYRTIELAQGWTGYLITTEPYFWGLDSIPMVLALGVFLVAHPSFCLPAYLGALAAAKKEGDAAVVEKDAA